jgi:hypothetical protein
VEVGDWVLLSADPDILRLPAIANAGHSVEVVLAVKSWTDDYQQFVRGITYPVIKQKNPTCRRVLIGNVA